MSETTYQGHTIDLNFEHRFTVKGPLVDSTFDSMREAKAEIDMAIKLKAVNDRETLGLAVATPEGRRVTIKGIHAAQSNLMFVEKGVDVSDVYVYDDNVLKLLEERAALKHRLGLIDYEIGKVKIKGSRGYGRLKPTTLNQKTEELKADHKKAVGNLVHVKFQHKLEN